MPTYDLTSGQPAINVDALNRVFLVQNRVDFVKNPVLATDLVNALRVPAKTFVQKVAVVVVAAGAGGETFDVEDGDSDAGWLSNVAADGVAGTCTATVEGSGAALPTAGGKYYAAADTIDIDPDHDLSAGIYDIFAWCLDFDPYCTSGVQL